MQVPGLATILGVVFIVLKLTDNIDWSWWWVLAPFWIPAIIIFVVWILAMMTLKKTKKVIDRRFDDNFPYGRKLR